MPLDYKEYPADWNKIRERILIRAKDCCEQCGLKNHKLIYKFDRSYILDGDQLHLNSLMDMGLTKLKALKMLKLTEIVLTIAHLNHDKENHQVTDDRLKALCQKCHLQYDLPRHIENRKYGRNFRKNQHKLF